MVRAPTYELDRLVDYSDASILAEVRRVAGVLPAGPITRRAFDQLSKVKSTTLLRRFGGWQQVLDAAGMHERYSGQPVSSKMRAQHGREWSDARVLEEIRRVAAMLGAESLTAEDFERHGEHVSTAVARARFGTWAKALRAAGLSASKHAHRYSDDDFFENLLTVWTYYGRSPRYAELDRPPSTISAGGYYKRFGTWGRAKLAFIERMNADGAADAASPASSPSAPAPPTAGAARRERRSEAEQRSIRIGLRYEILRRDHFRCVLCGASPATEPSCRLHVDHIVPVAAGGLTIATNLRTTCEPCNLGKGAKTESVGA